MIATIIDPSQCTRTPSCTHRNTRICAVIIVIGHPPSANIGAPGMEEPPRRWHMYSFLEKILNNIYSTQMYVEGAAALYMYTEFVTTVWEIQIFSCRRPKHLYY